MFCPECGKEASGKFCCHCGSPLPNIETENVDAPTNGNNIDYELILKECEYDKEKAALRLKKETGLKYKECKELLSASYDRYIAANPRPVSEPLKELKNPWEEDTTVRCPKCGSTSISANKNGYGFGKATLGLIAAGPVGLLAGGIGSKGVMVTCLSCGHQFKAGKGM